MAEIIKHGTPRTHVGLRGRCNVCGCEFVLGEGDTADWREDRYEDPGHYQPLTIVGAYYTRCPEKGCGAEVRIVPPKNGGAELVKALAFAEKAKAERGRG